MKQTMQRPISIYNRSVSYFGTYPNTEQGMIQSRKDFRDAMRVGARNVQLRRFADRWSLHFLPTNGRVYEADLDMAREYRLGMHRRWRGSRKRSGYRDVLKSEGTYFDVYIRLHSVSMEPDEIGRAHV